VSEGTLRTLRFAALFVLLSAVNHPGLEPHYVTAELPVCWHKLLVEANLVPLLCDPLVEQLDQNS
jgi:hypothetical protein